MPKQACTQEPEWRAKIRAGNIATRLLKCFAGELELTKGQIQIGLKFLDKFMPDLKSVEVSGDVTHNHKELTLEKSTAAREELIKYAKKFIEPTTPTTH